MTSRQFILKSVGLGLLAVLAYWGIGAIIAAFNLYNRIEPNRYLPTEQRLAKRAILRNPIYDSYFVGGSMSELFSIPEFNKAFGAHFAQMTLSGGTSYEQLNILRQLPKRPFKFLVLEV